MKIQFWIVLYFFCLLSISTLYSLLSPSLQCHFSAWSFTSLPPPHAYTYLWKIPPTPQLTSHILLRSWAWRGLPFGTFLDEATTIPSFSTFFCRRRRRLCRFCDANLLTAFIFFCYFEWKVLKEFISFIALHSWWI